MDKASYPKTLGGAVPEHSLLQRLAPRKPPLERPCSPREKLACVLPVRPGALAKTRADGGSAWEKHSAAVQRYLQSCHGAGERLRHVSPLPGEPGTEMVLGTSLHSETGIPPASVARLGLSKRLLPTGWLLPMRRLLPTGIFSLVQAKEAGKHVVPVQGVWGQAAQGLAAKGASAGSAEPWAGRGGSAVLPTFAGSWLPRFLCSK